MGSVWLQASWSHGILNCLCPGLWAVFSLVGMMVFCLVAYLWGIVDVLLLVSSKDAVRVVSIFFFFG